MNKTYRKNILRSVRSSASRFLAIFAIVALGVGFLAGLLASPVDMRLSADRYYDDSNLYDLRIVSTLGLTEDDLKEVREVPGVQAAEPVYDTDMVLLSKEGDFFTARIHTLPEDGLRENSMNLPVLQSGRFPEKPGECIVTVTKSLIEGKDWIGQTLTAEKVEEDEGSEKDVPESLTVVGTVKSAAYLSMEQEHTTVGTGTVNLIVYTLPESFSYDYYTGFYLSIDGSRELNSFGQEYEDTVAAVRDILEPLGEERARLRYEQIVGDAQKELNEAKAEYEDKKAETEQELQDAQEELDKAQKEIEENRQKLADAKREIDSGQAELDESRASYNSQIIAAQAQIDDGYAQLQSYQAQLDEGIAEIKSAQAQLDKGFAQLKEGEAKLQEAKAQLDETEASLSALESGKTSLWSALEQLGFPSAGGSDEEALEAIAQLETLSPEIGTQFAPLKAGLEALAAQGTDTAASREALEAGKATYEENVAQAKESEEKLEASQKELDEKAAPILQQQEALNAQKAELDQNAAALQQTMASARLQFASAEEELEEARAQYREGLQKLKDGEKELDKGRQEYDKGKAEAEEKLGDAEEKLQDAESQIREIEEGEWYLFTREDNAGYSSYGSNADKIGAIATVFPVFFFLVAALVALTTMTRMVEEDRLQIGTLKALGYSTGKIAVKYLLYAGAASILGSAFGLAVGLRLFPTVIINAYNIMYDIPRALTPFNLPFSLFSSLTAILCTLAATLNACWAALRESPASLMLPKAPKAGKRIFLEYLTPIWSRMRFTRKVTARNLLRYKKRFFMTVIGIAGCTALLLTGFGVRDSVSPIVDLQYEQLNRYQLILGLKDESALNGRDLKAVLGDPSKIAGSLAVMQDSGEMVPKKGDPADSVTIFAPKDVSALPDYFQFRHRTDSEPVIFDEDAVIVTEKLARRQHLKKGEAITVKNKNGVKASLTITDICENYVSHYVYLSPSAYEKAFGEPAAYNTLLCKLPEEGVSGGEAALSTQLLSCRDVAAARFTTELSESFSNSIQSLNSIVLVLIISAGALAFVVLYNLTNINIGEREKEIATIKVLGFYDGEVSAYIYRETAMLTLIGTAAGLVLGIFLHQFVIQTAEIDIVMFGRNVLPLSYVWSALLTILFSVLVNLVMHRKLKHISMVESMKAPE